MCDTILSLRRRRIVWVCVLFCDKEYLKQAVFRSFGLLKRPIFGRENGRSSSFAEEINGVGYCGWRHYAVCFEI